MDLRRVGIFEAPGAYFTSADQFTSSDREDVPPVEEDVSVFLWEKENQSEPEIRRVFTLKSALHEDLQRNGEFSGHTIVTTLATADQIERLVKENRFTDAIDLSKTLVCSFTKSHCIDRVIKSIPLDDIHSLLQLIETIACQNLQNAPKKSLAMRLFSIGKSSLSREIIACVLDENVKDDFCMEKARELFRLGKTALALEFAETIGAKSKKGALLCFFIESFLNEKKIVSATNLLEKIPEESDKNRARKALAKARLQKGDREESVALIEKISDPFLQLSCYKEFPFCIDDPNYLIAHYLIDYVVKRYTMPTLYALLRHFIKTEDPHKTYYNITRYLATCIPDTQEFKTAILFREVSKLISKDKPEAAYYLSGPIPDLKVKSRARYDVVKQLIANGELDKAELVAEDIPDIKFKSAAFYKIVRAYIFLNLTLAECFAQTIQDDTYRDAAYVALAKGYARIGDAVAATIMLGLIKDKKIFELSFETVEDILRCSAREGILTYDADDEASDGEELTDALTHLAFNESAIPDMLERIKDNKIFEPSFEPVEDILRYSAREGILTYDADDEASDSEELTDAFTHLRFNKSSEV